MGRLVSPPQGVEMRRIETPLQAVERVLEWLGTIAGGFSASRVRRTTTVAFLTSRDSDSIQASLDGAADSTIVLSSERPGLPGRGGAVELDSDPMTSLRTGPRTGCP